MQYIYVLIGNGPLPPPPPPPGLRVVSGEEHEGESMDKVVEEHRWRELTIPAKRRVGTRRLDSFKLFLSPPIDIYTILD